MYCTIHEIIRRFAMEMSEGEVVKKFKAQPKEKPPRRRPSVQNISNRTDYMKNYMEKYRKEDGKDYQKIPKLIRELRKKQKKQKKMQGKIENIYNRVLSTIKLANVGIGASNPFQTLIIS